MCETPADDYVPMGWRTATGVGVVVACAGVWACRRARGSIRRAASGLSLVAAIVFAVLWARSFGWADNVVWCRGGDWRGSD